MDVGSWSGLDESGPDKLGVGLFFQQNPADGWVLLNCVCLIWLHCNTSCVSFRYTFDTTCVTCRFRVCFWLFPRVLLCVSLQIYSSRVALCFSSPLFPPSPPSPPSCLCQ